MRKRAMYLSEPHTLLSILRFWWRDVWDGQGGVGAFIRSIATNAPHIRRDRKVPARSSPLSPVPRPRTYTHLSFLSPTRLCTFVPSPKHTTSSSKLVERTGRAHRTPDTWKNPPRASVVPPDTQQTRRVCPSSHPTPQLLLRRELATGHARLAWALICDGSTTSPISHCTDLDGIPPETECASRGPPRARRARARGRQCSAALGRQ
ncbi:uncharacterized protein C8Q71DRAFT_791769 [Rhodofomes roseus]|uniref:Uncharacterized protein n=1 Tax=Rhodofomes roseus TaxID=34475 RepID=A0ABQ8JXZ0_9APHY|nr:uncharacterized protein C8Q71DRAFT_791769 [Rhodofomes roseus]KAH9829106.1 hypothetical protein C8Q71DRAFT_791769 [Rhodofomes roseus]